MHKCSLVVILDNMYLSDLSHHDMLGRLHLDWNLNFVLVQIFANKRQQTPWKEKLDQIYLKPQ